MSKRLIESDEITRKVDARGRVSLPEELANCHITIRKAADGTYIIQQLELVPKPTAWFWKNQEAQAMVSRGLKDLAEGRLSDFSLDDEDVSWLQKSEGNK
jgi:hypothetical protein